jgi:hypothetical protein
MKPMRTLLLALTAVCTSFAVDPASLRMIPADSAFIAGIHADQIKTSRFGQFLLDQLKSEEANFEKFVSATGFDPRRDLSELLVASGEKPGKGKTIVVAKGRFDATRIQSFARSEGSETTTYAGVTIFTGRSGQRQGDGWLAVLDSATAIAGDADSVRLALDKRASSTGQLDPTLANKIAELSTRYDAWMISTGVSRLADDLHPNVGSAMQNNLFASMESVTGGVRFGANVELMAEAVMRSEKDATAMVDVVRFLAGMLQMNTQDRRAAEFASLLDKMESKSSGNQFRLSLMIPEATLEGLVKPAARVKKSPVI